MINQEIKQLSQITHCLERPSMYVGSIVQERQEEFNLQDELFVIKERSYIPALIKVFNEWIDNSIDEYVRTNGKHSNKISVKITHNTFECQDNGRGIPNTKMKTLNGEEKYQAEVAFTEMLSGSNYENDDEATIGTNGLGSKAGSIFAKKSVIVNDDGKIALHIQTKNNLSEVHTTVKETKSTGVKVKVYPDLKYFGITEIDEVHINVIKERLLHLSIAYPGITFKFNNKTLRINPKNYFGMFGIKEFIHDKNYSIGVSHASSEQFEQFSLINGLVTKKGGNHIRVISDDLVNPIRERLVKKFKTIKPADIRQKLRIVVIFNEFMNARYTSQTKEELTNSDKEIKSFLGESYKDNIPKLVAKVLKNDDIMLPITELFLLKEQAKQNANLKKLAKTKKIKSEKYLPATKHKKILYLCEGACIEENTEVLLNNFKSKKIKNLTVNDILISEDLTEINIKAITKHLKESITFNTPEGKITSSKEHRFRVYDTVKNDFIFEKAINIHNNNTRYKFLKSKINTFSNATKVISNKNNTLTCEHGLINYTNNDYFIIKRNSFIKVHASDIKKDDIIIIVFD